MPPGIGRGSPIRLYWEGLLETSPDRLCGQGLFKALEPPIGLEPIT